MPEKKPPPRKTPLPATPVTTVDVMDALSLVFTARRRWIATTLVLLPCLLARPANAQTPPPAPPPPPPPLVIGRDAREQAEVVGKNFLLRVWLSNVGGAGMQS